MNQAPPFVAAQVCTAFTAKYQNFFNTCDPNSPLGGSLSNPWGELLGPTPTGNPADISKFLPTASQIMQGAPLFSLGVYNRANKLPYTINNTLDIQWQPRNDLAIEIGYVGNLGRHAVIPMPFNQPGIATPTNPIHGQEYTYGYQVVGPAGCSKQLRAAYHCPTGRARFCPPMKVETPICAFLTLAIRRNQNRTQQAGDSAYNALHTHVEKRISHGLQAGFSYTYSHSLDEQSALGLLYNGNNPLNLRSGYGSSDFDRTHVFNFNYFYELPKVFP